MGTRAAAFSAKIKSLRELQTKISQNVLPVPTGLDLSNSYRWFSTTLLSILRDVPGLPYLMIRDNTRDNERLCLFPNLDYKDLYDTLYEFIPDIRIVSNQEKCGKSLLILFASLLPFMERSTIEDFPYNITELIDVLPEELCEDAVDTLCENLLPFILVPGDSLTQTSHHYVPAMIQTVMYKSPRNTPNHRKLVECVMAQKQGVHIDLLHVIAYGPTSSKLPAVNLLFFYWPSLNPTPAERKDIVDRFQTEPNWIPAICTNLNCESTEPAEATKLCLDHSIPLNQRSDIPPPALYCYECTEKVLQKRSKSDPDIFEDLNMPIDQIEVKCENKNCRSTDKIGVCSCFSPECTFYNSHRPIRYCEQCHRIRHNERRRTTNHVLQKPVISPWKMSFDDREVMLASVISLLSLAKPFSSDSQEEHHARTMILLDDADTQDDFTFDDYLMASRYGVWLLAGLCMPDEPDSGLEMAGLLSMLFEWYKVTATLPGDKSGAVVEKIKSDFLPPWLRELATNHHQVFVQCLIPEPEDIAKVGGHWEIIAPETYHIKEGLARLFCLVSFDIITLNLWEEIAPRWMDAIQKHFLKESLPEIGSIFCRIFDPDMSPLGFQLEQMYQFACRRMDGNDPDQQQTVLGWMQILCHLGVTIPLNILFSMYSSGIRAWRKENVVHDGLILKLLQIYSKMIDVLITQFKQQDVEENVGMTGPQAQNSLNLALDMITSTWLEQTYRRKPTNETQQDIEENLFIFTQLFRSLLRHILSNEQREGAGETRNSVSIGHTLIAEDKKETLKRQPGIGGFMAVLSSTFKTTVETMPEDGSDSDSSLTDLDLEQIKDGLIEVEDHPPFMQLLYRLIILISETDEPDIVFYTLDALKCLALNEDGLVEMSKKYKKMFCWLQAQYIIPTTWKLLDTNHSQIATIAVPILLHSLPVRAGSDILWKILDQDFNHADWKRRFAAVEKTTLVFRFLDSGPVRQSQRLRSVLSHAFCLLLSSMDDISVHVAQRSTVYIGTIHDKALASLLYCLECQFDVVCEDRPHLLKSLYQLFNMLIDRHVLSWEFFYSRFDTVISEILEQDSDRDIEDTKNGGDGVRNGVDGGKIETDGGIMMDGGSGGEGTGNGLDGGRGGGGDGSRTRIKSGTDSYRSLAQHQTYPYKRTISAPAGMGLSVRSGGRSEDGRTRIQEDEKGYRRQQSAPNTRHKISKTGSELGPTHISRILSNPGTIPDELDFKDVAAKSMDLENIEKETIHLLVFLFMQFLSHTEQAKIPENKNSLEYIHMQKCFQCLFSLLGFDDKESRFTTMPHKVRSTSQFSSFFANIPQVMDNNFPIGNFLISNIVLILQKSPFPPRYAANWQPTHSILRENLIYQGCGYTLWHLEPTTRKNWLEAALVIVYKYNFSEPETLSEKVLGLIRIILNSLTAHVHICSKFGKQEGFGLTMRSRELSETSIGPLGTATLQGTEENSAYNSRTSPTSNPKEDPEEEQNPALDQKEVELETIFENVRSSSPDSSDGLPKNISVENPLFFNLLAQQNPDLSEFNPENEALVSERLPLGWTMQEMDNGKVLYVDNNTQFTTWQDPRVGSRQIRRKGPFFNSPPSPLSLMDVLTIGTAPGKGDKIQLTKGVSEEEEEEYLHPPPERLLPIGNQEPRRVGRNKTNNLSLLDRVWQVLGSNDQNEDCVPLVETDLSSKIKIASENGEHNGGESNYSKVCLLKENVEKDGSEPVKEVRKRRFGAVQEPQGLVLKEDEEEESTDVGWNNVESRSSFDQSKDYRITQPLTRQSHLRIGEDTVIDRCSRCGAIQEKYSHPELSLCLVVLNTLVHRDPELTAPLLPEIFIVVSRLAGMSLYSWEEEGSLIIIPGNPRSVARQFLRVSLQQLSTNGIFPLLFKLDLDPNQRKRFFSTIVSCLNDFSELSPTVPMQLFFENIGSLKPTLEETLNTSLPNITCYLSFIQFDHVTNWGSVFAPLENFYRNLALLTSSQDGSKDKIESQTKNAKISNIGPVLSLIVYTMKMPGVNNHRSILEPIIKVICFAIQSCTFKFQDLVDICSFCNKTFNKERDKNSITKAITAEFVHALKYKTCIPDVNFLYLGSMMLQDAKGELPPSSILDDAPSIEMGLTGPIHTGATECLRPHIPDIVDFVADVHTLSKVKSNVRGTTMSLNQDTLGGILKAGLSQFLALEIARMSGDRDVKFVTKYLPWLFNPPNMIVSQGPKEFLDCVSHIRLLSWLLLGAVSYTMLVGVREGRTCQPIPLEASCHIADHIEVILAGFAEQSKTSVVHMCSLFHAFILCQLWTVYLEHVKPTSNNKDEQLLAPSILLDFWVKVTPGILQLVSHSKVLAEMVNLHFLSLMEALLECRSTILTKLMPLWCPVLHAYSTTLPDHICVRLQNIEDAAPKLVKLATDTKVNNSLVNWLQRLQFKMGQIELQASNATQQFFSV